MADQKKISFGFSKTSKLINHSFAKKTAECVQYVDCLESKTIKVKGPAEKLKNDEIVIPINNVSNRKGNKLLAIIKQVRGEETPTLCIAGGLGSHADLDSTAARELIAEARKSQLEEVDDKSTLNLTVKNGQSSNDEESTLEDYDTVPVSKYGAAMLRGMGWDPTKGIGKNEKVVATFEPKVRPRGMGLGVVLQKSVLPLTSVSSVVKPEEELKIVIGAYAQVTSGSHKNMYGKIEGFCEETGRLILKLAISGSSVSMNEYMIQPVSKDEFTKNSRVINASKYKEYKSKETSSQQNGSVNSSRGGRKRRDRQGSHSRSPPRQRRCD